MCAMPSSRRARRWVFPAAGMVALAVVAGILAWPTLVRGVLLSRLQAITNRPASVETVELNPFTGRLDIRGLRVLERDGTAPFTDVDGVHVRVRPLALLTGHLWIREAVIEGSTVRLVRFGDEFNISDLLSRSEPTERRLDVSVDHFVVTRGTVLLEDRALAEPRTWTSEQIEIDARNLSTRGQNGTAVASSITAGAPVSLEMRNVRLHPIHLEAHASTTGLDLSAARVYFPPEAAVTLERGRADSTIDVVLDAKAGVQAHATGALRDVALVRQGERDPAVRVPGLALELSGLSYEEEQLAIGKLELAGSASIMDRRTGRWRDVSAIRASIADVSWPITGTGRVDIEGRIPGGGLLKVTGSLSPPPTASRLRMTIARADLAPWAQLVPLPVTITGVVEGDLRVNEPLAPAVPAHVRGSIAVNRLGVRDDVSELFGARRVEAKEFEVDWPARLAVKQLIVSAPRAAIERDRNGEFPIRRRLAPGSPDRSADAGPRAAADHRAVETVAVTVEQIAVRGGAITWRDRSVKPEVAADFTRLDVTVTGAAWPLPESLGVAAAVEPPGGGYVRAAGRVALDPLSAELRVTGKGVELAPYQPYVPLPARIVGQADVDVAVAMPPGGAGEATVRGNAAVSRVDVRDGLRTVLKADRAAASGIDIEWPRRVVVRDVKLQEPWILLERDREGALPLRTLVTPRSESGEARRSARDAGASARGAPSESDNGSIGSVPITVGRVVVENGGARVVDQRVTPPFALDFQRLAADLAGLSTDPASKPARLELTGRASTTSLLAVRGTVGPLGGPLHLDVHADLQGFPVPRTNPYLIDYVSWSAREGWLTTAVRCRIDGDELDARTDLRVSRLELAKAGGADEAQARIGLPLGTIVALMKDSRGDIRVSLPVGGRLSDPRFELSEAIWSTVRHVAFKAVTAPVSWIGRVRYTADSRIERIDIDPIEFPPGQTTLTPRAQEQVARVAAFLEQTPAARVALTPVVTERDAAPPRQGDRALPKLKDLAEQRLETIRGEIKNAGVDPDRLRETRPSDAPTDAEPQVKLDLIQPDAPASAERPGFFRRLFRGGFGGDAAKE